MSYKIIYLPEAEKDSQKLDKSVMNVVRKTIENAAEFPLSKAEGGKGKPLGNKTGINLTNFLELKLRQSGVRVIYKVERTAEIMQIIIIGMRSEFEVYRDAKRRIDKYGL
jgi:mRNA interferase RelE/StbE